MLEADGAAFDAQPRGAGGSGNWRGTAIERMPSCTVPTFSKIAVTFCATQPAMLAICQVSGSAMAMMPTLICPPDHSHSATAPVLTTIVALSVASDVPNRVIRRNCLRNAAVCSSTVSRTKASSSRGRAKSLTVRMLV
jgi:hypothetical protein